VLGPAGFRATGGWSRAAPRVAQAATQEPWAAERSVCPDDLEEGVRLAGAPRCVSTPPRADRSGEALFPKVVWHRCAPRVPEVPPSSPAQRLERLLWVLGRPAGGATAPTVEGPSNAEKETHLRKGIDECPMPLTNAFWIAPI